MEASQASEAGSIPVARSSPARPRAGRFCYAHFAPTVYRMRRDNRRNTLPARVGARGSGTKLAPHEPHGATSGTKLTPRELGPAVPVQNSPCTPKISQFGAFCSCWESFIPFLLPTSRAWRVFSRTNTSTTTGTKETTPPHNTQSHAMKDYPPTLHTQHDAMKHLPPSTPQTTKIRPFSPCRGELSFTTHTTHPRQGDISFNQRLCQQKRPKQDLHHFR